MTTITKEARDLFHVLIQGNLNEESIVWYIQTVWDCLPQVKVKDIQYLSYLKEQNENIKERNHLRIVDNNKKVTMKTNRDIIYIDF
tara:strand:+ start:100 stop:357 length:258 start_codon:yes stop_codon:yes gene_type:complete